MATTTKREEIPLNDLQSALDAALLLRKCGLISAAKLREIREVIHDDCLVNLNRYSGSAEIARMLDNVWRQSRPL